MKERGELLRRKEKEGKAGSLFKPEGKVGKMDVRLIGERDQLSLLSIWHCLSVKKKKDSTGLLPLFRDP